MTAAWIWSVCQYKLVSASSNYQNLACF